MELNRRRLIACAGGTLVFALAPWEIAHGAKMVAVRMWPAEEYTRVTIETDIPLFSYVPQRQFDSSSTSKA